jgi:hypothetical protein
MRRVVGVESREKYIENGCKGIARLFIHWVGHVCAWNSLVFAT